MTTPGSRQDELLDELVELFLAEGFQQFTLEDLTRRLHCSKTTLYTLGHSKEALTMNALRRFFSRSGTRVDERAAAETEPDARIVAYLRAVAGELRAASPEFIAQVAAHPAAREIYERNTRFAAERVAAMIGAGVSAGRFRAIDPAFAADLIAATMVRIQSGDVRRGTDLDDAAAYDELADLVLNGILS